MIPKVGRLIRRFVRVLTGVGRTMRGGKSTCQEVQSDTASTFSLTRPFSECANLPACRYLLVGWPPSIGGLRDVPARHQMLLAVLGAAFMVDALCGRPGD